MEVDLVKEGGGSDQTSALTSIIVVQNWIEELKARVARAVAMIGELLVILIIALIVFGPILTQGTEEVMVAR